MGRLHICGFTSPPSPPAATPLQAFIHTLEGNTQRPLARLRLGCGLQRSRSAPEAREAPAAARLLRGCCAVAVNALRVYQDGGEEEQMDEGRAADVLRWW